MAYGEIPIFDLDPDRAAEYNTFEVPDAGLSIDEIHQAETILRKISPVAPLVEMTELIEAVRTQIPHALRRQ